MGAGGFGPPGSSGRDALNARGAGRAIGRGLERGGVVATLIVS